MTRGRTYMDDAADTPRKTLSVTRCKRTVIDVVDTAHPTLGKVEAGLLADVPAGIAGRSPGGAGHVPDLEVLDPDHVEPARDVGAGLLGPVLAPVRLAGFQPGDRVPDPPAAVRAAPGAGELTLQPQHPGACRAAQPGYT